MRRFACPVLLVLAAACGGSGPTATTTTPTPGTPASVATVSGDGQSAAPGSVLPVKLAVLVKDAAGLAVPGVTVRFAVDSGGGSLDLASAMTGANGVAVGGDWTLGSSAGTNVVSATVGTAPPARFHAQAFGTTARTLINNTVMGSGGGTIRYTKAGDPLSGLSITVPAAAYPAAMTWTIVADSSITVPLPTGFSQVGPMLVIGNGQGFADSVMTLTMPMRLAANETVAPFYFDPATNTLEGIPVVAGTDSSVTLATRHFTSDEMAIPGSGPSLSTVRGSLTLGFGSVRVVWVRTATANLVGTFTSTFRPGVDDWEFINYGDYIAPGGDCEGMSITAMFYHYFFHPDNQGPGLFHQFDQSLPNQWDNIQGIRFAGSVQGDYLARFYGGIPQMKTIIAQGIANGTPTKFLTASWIALTLQLTRQPVLLEILGPIGGHTVVAYAVTVNGPQVTVSFSDPNAPGVSRTMAFQNGILDPVPFQLNATSAPDYFTLAFALGVTSEVPLKQIVSRWNEFKAQQAGNDRYPKQYHLDDSISSSTTWNRLAPGDTIYTAQPFALRHLCPDCPTKRTGLGDLQFIKVWNAAGSAPLAGDTLPNPLPDGISSYQMVLSASSDLIGNGPRIGFVDALPITVKYHKFSATAPAGMVPGVPARLTAHPGVLATFQSVYTWTFNDGGTPAVVTVIGDSTVIRTFPPGGPYAVTVSLVDPVHGALGTVTVTVASTTGSIQFTISGAWDPLTTPANDNYAFTDFLGGRQASPGGGGLDILAFDYDLTPSRPGVLLSIDVASGATITAGQTFSKVPSGSFPVPGQWNLLLSTNLSTPDDPNSNQRNPVGTGTLTITSLDQLSGGGVLAHYSFTIDNGHGGSITGSGVGLW